MSNEVSATPIPPAERRGPRPSLWAGAAIIAAVAALGQSTLLLGAAAGGVVAAVLFPAAAWLLVLVFSALLCLPVLLSEFSIDAGGFTLYGADFVIPLLGYAGLYRLWGLLKEDDGVHDSREVRWMVLLLLGFCLYGIFHVVYSLTIQRYPYDQVFGAYRRLCFYPLAFLLPLWIPLKARHIRAIPFALVGAAVVLVGIGTWRLATGNPARLDEDFTTGYVVFRMLAITEYAVTGLFLAFAVSLIWIHPSVLIKIMALGLAAGIAMLMLFSGFRVAVVYIVAAPVLALALIMWLRRPSLRQALAGIVTVGAVGASAGLVGWFMFQEQLAKMVVDMRVRTADAEVTGDYREWIWQEAMDHFWQSPIIGQGLGHELVFPARTRMGDFLYREGSAHSTFMAVLYQMGIIGIALFLAFHAVFAYACWRNARHVPASHQALLVGLLVGWASFAGAAMTQPLNIAGYAAQALVLGFAVRLLIGPAAPQEGAAPST